MKQYYSVANLYSYDAKQYSYDVILYWHDVNFYFNDVEIYSSKNISKTNNQTQRIGKSTFADR